MAKRKTTTSQKQQGGKTSGKTGKARGSSTAKPAQRSPGARKVASTSGSPRPTRRPEGGRQSDPKKAAPLEPKPARRAKGTEQKLAAASVGRKGAVDVNGRNTPKEPMSEQEKPIKTYLSEAELQEFRDLLLEKRRELIGDVNNLQEEARRTGNPGGSGSSSMPIHMADLGSDTWEQELTLGLIENERTLLREIDEALERIDRKTYGVCMGTNKPITKARLRFKPWAKYCIEYARKRELGLA